MDRKVAEKAAKWWADHLRNPAKLDNGDKSMNGLATLVLATTLQDLEKEGQTQEKVDRFENALADILAATEEDYISLGVDYHPDRTLSRAAQWADLELGTTTLPWKTMMWITADGKIKVAVGYGAKAEYLHG